MQSDDQGFPVIEDGQLVGIVTLDDVRQVPQEDWASTSVRQMMAPKEKLVAIGPDQDAEVALNRMTQHDVRQLPVVQDDHLLGVLRRRDIIKWLKLHEDSLQDCRSCVGPDSSKEVAMKENTYTYTARSATDPNQVLTFTLHDDRMSVDVAVPLEQAQARLDEESEAGPLDMMSSWLAPGALSLVRWSTEREPFHIADVDVSAEDDGLGVTAWLRAGGLRLAPVAFYWEKVDNPDAAAAFVQEVQQRQDGVERPGKLPGPLDFWASWALGGVGVAALAVSAVLWLKSRNEEE